MFKIATSNEACLFLLESYSETEQERHLGKLWPLTILKTRCQNEAWVVKKLGRIYSWLNDPLLITMMKGVMLPQIKVFDGMIRTHSVLDQLIGQPLGHEPSTIARWSDLWIIDKNKNHKQTKKTTVFFLKDYFKSLRYGRSKISHLKIITLGSIFFYKKNLEVSHNSKISILVNEFRPH